MGWADGDGDDDACACECSCRTAQSAHGTDSLQPQPAPTQPTRRPTLPPGAACLRPAAQTLGGGGPTCLGSVSRAASAPRLPDAAGAQPNHSDVTKCHRRLASRLGSAGSRPGHVGTTLSAPQARAQPKTGPGPETFTPQPAPSPPVKGLAPPAQRPTNGAHAGSEGARVFPARGPPCGVLGNPLPGPLHGLLSGGYPTPRLVRR